VSDELARILAGSTGTPGGGAKRQAEMKSYEFPWYDRAYHALTDAVHGEHANARDLETTKRYTNAAIAAWPGAGSVLSRVPLRYSLPAAAMSGAWNPAANESLRRTLSGWALPGMIADRGNAIAEAGDPDGMYAPGARESENLRLGSDGKWTQRDWETAMYGQDGEPGFDTAMLAGPRERTPPNLSLEKVLADIEYARPKYPK
jgi:hypothetical protein